MPTNNFQLENFLPYRLVRLAQTVSDSLSLAYRDRFGITIPEWRMLANLAEHGRLNATAIGEMTSMDKSMVSRTVKLMEEKKLLLRESDPNDSRASSLRLSSRGETLFKKVAPSALQWETSLLQALSAAEYSQLNKILEKLEQRSAAMVLEAD